MKNLHYAAPSALRTRGLPQKRRSGPPKMIRIYSSGGFAKRRSLSAILSYSACVILPSESESSCLRNALRTEVSFVSGIDPSQGARTSSPLFSIGARKKWLIRQKRSPGACLLLSSGISRRSSTETPSTQAI